MLETRDGFLWIGTRGGLARFDGASFTIYKAGKLGSIPSDSITGLAEDRDGSLWISSGGGLTRYSGGQFRTFGVRDGLPATSIWRITSDPRGGVWAVTWQSRLFHFDGRKVQRYPTRLLKLAEDVNALVLDRQNTLWIATFRGVLAFNPQSGFRRFTRGDGLAGTRTFALALDCRGGVWMAGDGGLTHYAQGRFDVIHVPGLPTATLLTLDSNCRDQAVWTGSTGGGLFRVRPRGVQRMGASQGLISDELWMLYFSRDGSLWLGAIDGLNQLSDGSVTSYGKGDNVTGSTICMQTSQAADGELWFGCGSSLFRVSGSKLLAIKPGAVLPGGGERTRSVTIRAGGFQAIPLWVHSYRRGTRGMVLVDKHGRAILYDGMQQRNLPHIPWAAVGTMLIARDGTFWIAGSEIGVRAYPQHGTPRAFTTVNGLDDNNVRSLAEDPSGNIWVGTLSGLDRIRQDVATRVFACADVTSIDPSPDGSIWAASESGLIYVPPSRAPVRLFTQRDNLPTSVLEGVAADREGYLWLGTQQGVIRVRKSDLLTHNARALPIIFGTADGFHNAQSRLNSVFCSEQGTLWFVTLNEIATINPGTIQTKPLAPVMIEEVDLDDTPVILPSGSALTIPPGRHRVEMHYTLPNFQIPSRIHFRYRLEGWDQKWRRAGKLRYATYTGLPAGRYTFLVDNSDGYGRWSQMSSALPLRIVPYFYQTGWFVSLLALFVAAVIWRLHRLRVTRISAQMNARMQERTRIARELHDTLLQGVLGVSMQMYAVSQQSNGPACISPMLAHASQRLREIAEQSRRAVEGLRSPRSCPDSLEAGLTSVLRELNLPSELQPRIHSAGRPLQLDPVVQKEVEQIIREAVTNAFRHSGAEMVRIDLIYQPAHFCVSVTDSGCGIAPKLRENGRAGHWGILGMRERARAIGGELRILPHAPAGTVVELSLGGHNAYFHSAKRMRLVWWRRFR